MKKPVLYLSIISLFACLFFTSCVKVIHQDSAKKNKLLSEYYEKRSDYLILHLLFGNSDRPYRMPIEKKIFSKNEFIVSFLKVRKIHRSDEIFIFRYRDKIMLLPGGVNHSEKRFENVLDRMLRKYDVVLTPAEKKQIMNKAGEIISNNNYLDFLF